MWIDNEQDLWKILDILKNESFLAIDTEFIFQKTYYPKLCLLQIATTKEYFLIDALKVNINLLNDIWTNHNIIKIFHAAQKDIEIIEKQCQISIENVFDTQLTLMLCFYKTNFPSFQAIVELLLKKRIDKKQQMTNWEQRPLTKKQIHYAKMDVILLIEAYQKILEILQVQNKEDIAKQINQKINFQSAVFDIERNANKLCNEHNTEYYAFIKQMLIWRENKAQQEDISRKLIFNDQELLALINHLIKNNTDSEDNPQNKFFKNQKFSAELTEQIKKNQVINNAINSKNIFKNFTSNLNYDHRIINFFDTILDFLCEKESISKALVANKNHIRDFIYKKQGKLTEGWIYEKFGKNIENILHNRQSLNLSEILPKINFEY